MLKGAVKFHARIKGNGVTFPLVQFKPREAGVGKIELEAPSGDEILSTVYLSSVANEEDGKVIADLINTAVLNRISFFHNIAIDNPKITNAEFFPLEPEPGHLYAGTGHLALTGHSARFVIGLTADGLKKELEETSPSGERNFGLFRSARQSTSPVEEFMNLYHILLMLFNDSQSEVDAFIISEDPHVPQTQHPLKRPGVMETVYTRLRNEMSHHRPGINHENTRAEMVSYLGGLLALTKRAIVLRS